MLAQAAARQRQQQGTGSAGGNGGGSSGALAIGEQEKMSSPLPPMTNRAGESKSPYVLAHKDGPVHWQPLNDKTVERARREGKLIFMNIGFRACHLCHLTSEESFSHPLVAEILNHDFIPVLVDREERPDLDTIYMNYVQVVNGGGGWPLNLFLTPELEPISGCTYIPGPPAIESTNSKASSMAAATAAAGTGRSVRNEAAAADDDEERLDLLKVLRKLRKLWTEHEDLCRADAKSVLVHLREFAAEGTLGTSKPKAPSEDVVPPSELDLDQLEEAVTHMMKVYDHVHGGFMTVPSAPKFPTAPRLSFLLRLPRLPEQVLAVVGYEDCQRAAAAALHTLRRMRDGGLRDVVGGGFFRYSATPNWGLPRFEKTLPDQALLLGLYLDAWLGTRRDAASEPSASSTPPPPSSVPDEFKDVVVELAEYLTTQPIFLQRLGGGFASSEAADSFYRRGEAHEREGAYYLWTRREFDSVVSGAAAGTTESPAISSGSTASPSTRTSPQPLSTASSASKQPTPPPATTATPASSSSHDAAIAAAAFGVLDDGNVDPADDPHDEFLNQNVLRSQPVTADLARQFSVPVRELSRILESARARLREHRERERVRPQLDDKLVVAYNGMAIAALSRAGAALVAVPGAPGDEERGRRYIARAAQTASFIRKELWDQQDGVLYRVYREGRWDTRAFAEDYAFLIDGLLELYEATGCIKWLRWADELQRAQIKYFYDTPAADDTQSSQAGDATRQACGAFFSTAAPGTPGAAHTILRLKDGMDTSQPAINAVSARNLFRLAALVPRPLNPPSPPGLVLSSTERDYDSLARETINAFEVETLQHPWLFPGLLANVVTVRLGSTTYVVITEKSSAVDDEKDDYDEAVENASSGSYPWVPASSPAARFLRAHHSAATAALRSVLYISEDKVLGNGKDESNETVFDDNTTLAQAVVRLVSELSEPASRAGDVFRLETGDTVPSAKPRQTQLDLKNRMPPLALTRVTSGTRSEGDLIW